MKKSFVGGLAAVVCAASLSFAGSITFVEVPNGGGTDLGPTDLAGTVTTDIRLDSTGDDAIFSQQMRLILNNGSVFQHGGGGNTPPNSALFGFLGNLPYDTFLAAGAETSAGPMPSIVGRSDALGGPGGVPLQMDTTAVDALWGPALGQDTANQSNYLSTRFTLSPDANGTLSYRVTFGSGIQLLSDIQILEGHVILGEPNQAPEVGDIVGDDKIIIDLNDFPGDAIVSTGLPLIDEDPSSVMWELFSFDGPGAFFPADVDPNTGVFSWNANGAKEGLYTAVLKATDNGGLMDTGTLEICVIVPEPATLSLFGLALVGLVGFARRRG